MLWEPPSFSTVHELGLFQIFIFIYLFGRTRSSLQLAGSLVVVCGLLIAVHGIWFPDQGANPGPLHWECVVFTPEPPGSLGFDGRWGSKVRDYTDFVRSACQHLGGFTEYCSPCFWGQMNRWTAGIPLWELSPPRGPEWTSVWATREAVCGWLQCTQETLPRRFGRKYFPKLRFLVTYPSQKKCHYFHVSASSEQLGFPICLPG